MGVGGAERGVPAEEEDGGTAVGVLGGAAVGVADGGCVADDAVVITDDTACDTEDMG